MDGSSFYAYHSEFYLVEVNTHTDFGDLMQQLDHGTWERMRELFFNRKWHHRTTGSAKAMAWCWGLLYHKNASSALFVIWYLLCSRAIWRKMAKERLRALAVKFWNLGPIHWACHCCSNQHIPIHSHDISSQCFLYLWLLLGWTYYLFMKNNWEQTTVHNDLTTNVICYQYECCWYKQVKCCSFTEMLLAL